MWRYGTLSKLFMSRTTQFALASKVDGISRVFQTFYFLTAIFVMSAPWVMLHRKTTWTARNLNHIALRFAYHKARPKPRANEIEIDASLGQVFRDEIFRDTTQEVCMTLKRVSIFGLWIFPVLLINLLAYSVNKKRF